MTDVVQVALIAAVPPSLVALAGMVVSLHNKSKIRELHVTMNSRLDELVRQKGISSFAEGKAVGVETEREEVRARLEAKEPRVK